MNYGNPLLCFNNLIMFPVSVVLKDNTYNVYVYTLTQFLPSIDFANKNINKTNVLAERGTARLLRHTAAQTQACRIKNMGPETN